MVYIPDYCRSLDASMLTNTNFANALGTNWQQIVFISLVGMAFFLVLMYMLSQLLRIPRLEAWAKFEFFQVIATAVLAIFIAGWIYGMCHFDVSFLDSMYQGPSGAAIMANCARGAVSFEKEVTPFCVAQDYLDKVKKRGDDIFQVLMGLSYVISYMFKATWNSSPMGIGYNVDPLAGFQQLMNIFMVAVSGFMLSYISVLVQMRMLDFFLLAMPFYFMPIGLLLRTFEPTREFGGAVMGVVIASLFFYPLVLVMDSVLVYSTFDQLTAQVHDEAGQILDSKINPADNAQQINEIAGMYNPNADSNGQMTEKADANPDKISIDFTKRDPDTEANFASGDMNKLGATIFWPYQLIFIYSVVAVIMPILDFLIYVEVARGYTALLGTEVDLTNLTRLV